VLIAGTSMATMSPPGVRFSIRSSSPPDWKICQTSISTAPMMRTLLALSPSMIWMRPIEMMSPGPPSIPSISSPSPGARLTSISPIAEPSEPSTGSVRRNPTRLPVVPPPPRTTMRTRAPLSSTTSIAWFTRIGCATSTAASRSMRGIETKRRSDPAPRLQPIPVPAGRPAPLMP